jgi:hypothetical protein
MIHLLHSLKEEIRNLRQLRKSVVTWPGQENFMHEVEEPIPNLLKLTQLDDLLENEKLFTSFHRPKPSLTSTNGHPQKTKPDV